jgi:hypothetical protein
LDTFETIHTESLLSGNGEEWKYFFTGTNKFITESQEAGGKIKYTSYEFLKNDSRFCHKTCHSKCAGSNFTPCPLYSKIFYSMFWVTIGMLFVIIMFSVCVISKKRYDEEGDRDPSNYRRGTNSDGFVTFTKK